MKRGQLEPGGTPWSTSTTHHCRQTGGKGPWHKISMLLLASLKSRTNLLFILFSAWTVKCEERNKSEESACGCFQPWDGLSASPGYSSKVILIPIEGQLQTHCVDYELGKKQQNKNIHHVSVKVTARHSCLERFEICRYADHFLWHAKMCICWRFTTEYHKDMSEA